MVSLFSKDISYLKGVGPKSAVLFEKLGAPNVGALLHVYPRTYEDWSKNLSIHEALLSGEKSCMKLRLVSEVRNIFLRNGNKLCKAKATDGVDLIDIVFFNNVYAAKGLEMGKEYLVFGKVSTNGKGCEIINPEIRGLGNAPGLRPIYLQIKGLPSWKIESAMKNAVGMISDDFKETLPEYVIKKYNLCSLRDALENIHFPKNEKSLNCARKRLAFEELYFWQLGIAMFRKETKKKTNIQISKDYTDEFYFMLPFEPTGSQKRVIKECTKEIESNGFSMNRLIQGDVGSGKTVVAAAVIYNVIKNGYQAAFMVPTEVLASQHYNTITNLFNGLNVKVSVLTGSTKLKEKRKILDSVLSGEPQLVIGTHALISDSVEFSKLGFVVTDEQHRFGVRQRTKLIDKGVNPHILVMSATPIPRTLAFVMYGDLDVSVIDELPPGRQYIDTFCVGTNKKQRVYDFIKKHLDKGLQAYIVCPSIEESDMGLTAIETYAKDLDTGVFKEYSVGILHGKMKPSEKEEIMKKFKNGEYNLLISTTVIEVGIDVPNAVVMVIENAERFGLSQMHQLRGRVGRGKEKSYCVLISDSKTEDSLKRFKAMITTNDGFYLAGEDLKIRGPGQFLGAKQHGMPEMKLASVFKDVGLVKDCREAVEETICKEKDFIKQNFNSIKYYISGFFGLELNDDVLFLA